MLYNNLALGLKSLVRNRQFCFTFSNFFGDSSMETIHAYYGKLLSDFILDSNEQYIRKIDFEL